MERFGENTQTGVERFAENTYVGLERTHSAFAISILIRWGVDLRHTETEIWREHFLCTCRENTFYIGVERTHSTQVWRGEHTFYIGVEKKHST